ncbi:hypothetical protein ANN_00890 [Periplaneta americana]|uniref:Uncharacterized protein n=1 Tax=Periplaneta americana TaxID=6978 RepID=A0ABQ8TW33_PERAM|nr:hypothetical protein ANN_00890 [Periplaneta americana]
MTLLGTMRKNRRALPSKFVLAKGRRTASSLFGFQKSATIVSYCPKKGKVVTLLSTMHFKEEIAEDEKEKPIMVLAVTQQSLVKTQWTN